MKLLLPPINLIRLTFLFLILTLGLPHFGYAWKADQDPFAPFLTGKAPEIIKVIAQESDSVLLSKVLFHSREVNGIPTQVFAVIAKPLKTGKYPGMLVLHGGGGSAEIEKVRRWASKGYVAVSLDIPGVSNPEQVKNSSGNWKSYGYGKHRFTANPDVQSSVCFDGVLAAVQALYLLNNQPEVIQNNIGVSGISWGGYTTTMVCGLVPQAIKAAFSTYGSGFYDAGSTFLPDIEAMPEGERAVWLKYLDAGRRAKNIKAPFFIAAATNDNWFYPPAVMATLNAVGAQANHFFAPNASHSAPVSGGNIPAGLNRAGWMQMEETYFDFYLKNTGQVLPVVKTKALSKADVTAEGNYRIRFQVKAETPIVDAALWYSNSKEGWTKKKWVCIQAETLKNGWYQAVLPQGAVAGLKTYYFSSVSDVRPVTVSSKLLTIDP